MASMEYGMRMQQTEIHAAGNRVSERLNAGCIMLEASHGWLELDPGWLPVPVL